MPKLRILTPATPPPKVGGAYDYELEALEGMGAEIIECPATEAGFIAAAKGVDAVYAKGMKFTQPMIDALDKCRVISLGSVGVDYVDVAAATAKGIPVTNCPDTFIEEVADHAMMLLLATHRRAFEQDRMVREGRWSEGRAQLYEFPRLMGLTIGFIAFGRVPRAVAKRARPFGLHVLAFDPFPRRTVDCRGRSRAGQPFRSPESLRLRFHASAGHSGSGWLPEGAPFPADEENRHLHQHRSRADGQRSRADSRASGKMDRRGRARCF